MRKRVLVAVLVVVAASLTSAPGADAAPPWLDPRYLYRYVFWGIPSTFSKSDDWKLFRFHTIENAPPAFHFAPGSTDSMPTTVEYHESGNCADRE